MALNLGLFDSKAQTISIYQQGVEVKDIPTSEVRRWVREIGLIPFSISWVQQA